jgi:hypothetical protein
MDTNIAKAEQLCHSERSRGISDFYEARENPAIFRLRSTSLRCAQDDNHE